MNNPVIFYSYGILDIHTKKKSAPRQGCFFFFFAGDLHRDIYLLLLEVVVLTSAGTMVVSQFMNGRIYI